MMKLFQNKFSVKDFHTRSNILVLYQLTSKRNKNETTKNFASFHATRMSGSRSIGSLKMVSRAQKAPPTIALSVTNQDGTVVSDYQTNWLNQLVIFTHFWSVDISLNSTRNGKKPAFPDPTCERCMNTILVEDTGTRLSHTHSAPMYLSFFGKVWWVNSTCSVETKLSSFC